MAFHRYQSVVLQPSEAEGSAVPRTFLETRKTILKQNCHLACPAPGPERTRISCHAALDMATSAAFVKESRMKFANATKLDRKSGVAQWRDLRFSFGSHVDSEALMRPRSVWHGR